MLFNTVIPCSMAAALRYKYTNGNVLLPFFSLNSLYSNKEKNRRRKREAQTKVFSRPYRHIWLEQIAIDRSSIAIVAFVFQRFFVVVVISRMATLSVFHHKYSPIAYFLNTRRKFMRCNVVQYLHRHELEAEKCSHNCIQCIVCLFVVVSVAINLRFASFFQS